MRTIWRWSYPKSEIGIGKTFVYGQALTFESIYKDCTFHSWLLFVTLPRGAGTCVRDGVPMFASQFIGHAILFERLRRSSFRLWRSPIPCCVADRKIAPIKLPQKERRGEEEDEAGFPSLSSFVPPFHCDL